MNGLQSRKQASMKEIETYQNRINKLRAIDENESFHTLCPV